MDFDQRMHRLTEIQCMRHQRNLSQSVMPDQAGREAPKAGLETKPSLDGETTKGKGVRLAGSD